MRIAVIGAGAVGARAARQLASTPEVEHLTVVDTNAARADEVVAAIADPGRVVAGGTTVGDADVVVIATPAPHAETAARHLAAGAHVVSTGDDPDDVDALLALDTGGRTLLVGVGFGPGLTDLLAAHAATTFDHVDEVHVSRMGTGGPACARQHHRALAGDTADWRDGERVARRAGSGRELAWFPDPIGSADCYRAATPDVALLHRGFPGATRITARLAATRTDRLTARLPMLRPPHQRDDRLGAVRVEVRGRRGTSRDVVVLGAIDRPAVAAGAVAALAAVMVAPAAPAGVHTLATAVDTVPFLAELARRGVKAATFVGGSGAMGVDTA